MGDTRQNQGDRIRLDRARASGRGRLRGCAPQRWAVAAALGAALGATAAADPAPPGPLQADLDGLYVHLGPALGVVQRAGARDTVAGGSLSVLRVCEDGLVGIAGGRVTAARWTAGGGRVAAEAILGTERLGPMVGLSAGPLLDLGDDHHPRVGGSATIWWFAGVVPYVRVGVIEASGGFVEAGLELPLPIYRHRR